MGPVIPPGSAAVVEPGSRGRLHPGEQVDGPRRRGPVSRVLSGLAWNTTGQIATVVINLGLTPFLLHRLGPSRYGLLAFVSAFTGLVSNLDGGLGPTATRFIAIRVGAGDRRGQTSLLATLLCLLAVVTGAVALLGALVAPEVVSVLHMSPDLRPQAVVLLRLFLALGVVTALQQAMSTVVAAEHRWGVLAGIGIGASTANAVLVVVLLSEGMGLDGVFLAAVGSQVVALAGMILAIRRRLVWSAFRLMARPDVRELVSYSSRVQVAAVASSFTREVNLILVGLLFPVRLVAYYSIGSNFATQLTSLPSNAIAPIGVTLSRTFGGSSPEATVKEFTRLQRIWVRSVAAIPFIGAASAWFAIDRWLGTADRLAGVVAAILLLGQAATLLSLVMDSAVKAMSHPELESRYLGAGAALKVVVALALACSIGMLGVPIGTAAGAVVSALYFLRLTRRRLSADLRSFLVEIPTTALVLSVFVTLLLELPAFELCPGGVTGLLVCAIPGAVGLVVYGILVSGVRSPSQVLAALSSGARRPSGEP